MRVELWIGVRPLFQSQRKPVMLAVPPELRTYTTSSWAVTLMGAIPVGRDILNQVETVVPNLKHGQAVVSRIDGEEESAFVPERKGPLAERASVSFSTGGNVPVPRERAVVVLVIEQ